MRLGSSSKMQPISRVWLTPRLSNSRPRRHRRRQPRAAPATPAPAVSDLTSQLQQLSQLHNAGVLSDEEFAQAKQKLLAG